MGREDRTDQWDPKNRDPFIFKPADDFFNSLSDPKSNTQQPPGVKYNAKDQTIGAIPTSTPSAGSSGTPLPLHHPELESPLKIPETPGRRDAIIWETKENGLQYQDEATVLSVERPRTAKCLGFGEQGGKALFETYMNYFNFDNMQYTNVYNEGPENDAEPLYHSEPYWIEVNAHPGYMSQVATFMDNYSQVCVDLGKVDASRTRIATRFDSFQSIFIAGDDIGDIIQKYTSIIGRAWLRPRFVLGNHQGCYGYDNRDKVLDVARKYRESQIPLDGLHVDVDIQRGYRTFTIDTASNKFPDPKSMFDELRRNGVKCSTNITPVVRASEDPNYSTLNEGWNGSDNYFVRNKRAIDPSAPTALLQRYLQYGRGDRYFNDPNTQRPEYGDSNNFNDNFDSGWPFHGGVGYGGDKGAPGFYPNLNRKEVRIWWGTQYKYLLDMGLEFVWQDMTSPRMAQQYGDMKSWPFRLLLDSDGWPQDPLSKSQKKAIEIWSLYSYNLHKAKFKGLHKQEARKGKRNFIIGRGSFAGAERYAGLWTGDNSSTWSFLNISVAQVLALGLAGVSIAVADVGGFEPESQPVRDFADSELLIRWYCAYSLLPWFRYVNYPADLLL
ncbi:hypothetical protein MMC25_006126 [Agyrium rufum]|nr:hypothetical protein [Agyrium rufum]